MSVEEVKVSEPSSSRSQRPTPSGVRSFHSSFIKKRDTVISVVRSNYRTSIHNMKMDQFTMVICQNYFDPISPYFLLFKYCHFFIMLVALVLSTSERFSVHKQHSFIAWHLFLDHWVSVAGTAEALCGVFTVTYFYHHCRTKAMRDSYYVSEGLSLRLLIYAFINSTTITFICSSSVIFWFFIYGKSSNTPISYEHIVMPALQLVKMHIEMIPFTVDRFMYPVLLMLIYFINVIAHYYLFNHKINKKAYIFIYFNDDSLLHFLWFVLESLLITAVVHILLTLIWHARWLFVYFCCPKKSRHHSAYSERKSPNSLAGYVMREDYVEAVPDPRKKGCGRCLERIADLERLYRHDFIQPEWKQKLSSRPATMYVIYRACHMFIHFFMVFITLFEPEKPLRMRRVKYFILWGFYFGNFFLCVSFIQSLAGFVVIVKAYTRKTSLKYYERSELHVTGFQKFYAAVNGSAVVLAIFTFASSWLLVNDMLKFSSHDYLYDVPHLANPLSMCLDFIVVGHPYKFIYLVLSSGFLTLNIVFNYWLYSSKITGRSGAKLIYSYLNWDKPLEVMLHIAVLFSILIALHLSVWLMFLSKRMINVAYNRRQLYRPRQQKAARGSCDSILDVPPPVAFDLSAGHIQDTDTGKSGGSSDKTIISSKSLNSAKS